MLQKLQMYIWMLERSIVCLCRNTLETRLRSRWRPRYRGVKFETTTLEEAAKYALISLDSTMRSNVTVGPPIDLLSYKTDELEVKNHRRFVEDDPHLMGIRRQWEQALRKAVQELRQWCSMESRRGRRGAFMYVASWID